MTRKSQKSEERQQMMDYSNNSPCPEAPLDDPLGVAQKLHVPRSVHFVVATVIVVVAVVAAVVIAVAAVVAEPIVAAVVVAVVIVAAVVVVVVAVEPLASTTAVVFASDVLEANAEALSATTVCLVGTRIC